MNQFAHQSEHEARYVISQGRSVEIWITRFGVTDQDPIEGNLVDLSPSGTKISVRHSLQFGEAIGLQIKFTDLQLEIGAIGHVSWIRPLGDESWLVGCSFNPRISGEILERLADKGYIERRQDHRNQSRVELEARWQLEDEPVAVGLRDYSPGGFCLESCKAAKIGDRILVKAPLEDQLHDIRGTVQWQVHDGEQYLIGCALGNSEDFRVLFELATA